MFDTPDSALTALIRSIRLVVFDFDGVFTDNTVLVAEDGTESVTCWRGDGIGLRQLEAVGCTAVIISTETNVVVQARSRKLAIRCFHGCADKRTVLDQLIADMGLSLKQVAFVGNDVNDLPCLLVVALPIVVHDAHPDVLRVARIRTRTPGGRGAVREVCDLFASVLRASR